MGKRNVRREREIREYSKRGEEKLKYRGGDGKIRRRKGVR